jgi:hypothetical protein
LAAIHTERNAPKDSSEYEKSKAPHPSNSSCNFFRETICLLSAKRTGTLLHWEAKGWRLKGRIVRLPNHIILWIARIVILINLREGLIWLRIDVLLIVLRIIHGRRWWLLIVTHKRLINDLVFRHYTTNN